MAPLTAQPDSIISSNANTTSTTPSAMPAKAAAPAPKRKGPKPVSKNQVEVPIFLRKTYHMIDTCDSNIASWSEDGETFVVKQPKIFESTIIPQFFKHSKFSSFVRQLNFYGFRKIKYSDTIKIDAQLEAETANYWRFRHEHFLRGRPELLNEIKRSNNQSGGEKQPKGKVVEKAQDVEVIKTDVDTLKDRIAMMSSEIESLTNMVQNITMKEKTVKAEPTPEAVQEDVVLGTKRRKVSEFMDSEPATLPSSLPVKEEEMDIEFTPMALFPTTTQQQSQPQSAQEPSNSGSFLRQSSISSAVSDEAFVDDLFNVFDADDLLRPPSLQRESSIVPEEATSLSFSTLQDEENFSQQQLPPNETLQKPQQQQQQTHPNSPDPKLMGKLSDALTVLPKDIQEMLVNKLISTITSSDALKAHIDAVSSSTTNPENTKEESDNSNAPQELSQSFTKQNPDIALPLAAATLTAIISQYSAIMKSENRVKTSSIPVIPIHA